MSPPEALSRRTIPVELAQIHPIERHPPAESGNAHRAGHIRLSRQDQTSSARTDAESAGGPSDRCRGNGPNVTVHCGLPAASGLQRAAVSVCSAATSSRPAVRRAQSRPPSASTSIARCLISSGRARSGGAQYSASSFPDRLPDAKAAATGSDSFPASRSLSAGLPVARGEPPDPEQVVDQLEGGRCCRQASRHQTVSTPDVAPDLRRDMTSTSHTEIKISGISYSLSRSLPRRGSW